MFLYVWFLSIQITKGYPEYMYKKKNHPLKHFVFNSLSATTFNTFIDDDSSFEEALTNWVLAIPSFSYFKDF